MVTGNNVASHINEAFDFEEIKRFWLFFVIVGLVIALFGFIVSGTAIAATKVFTALFGIMLIVAGFVETVHAFLRGRWGGFLLDLLAGILYVVAGFMIVANPGASAIALTLIIAMFLIIIGIFRLVTGMMLLLPHRGWVILSGVISLLLGIAIWRQWPFSGLWVIGLFVGIEMIFNGLSLVMLGFSARKLETPPSASP